MGVEAARGHGADGFALEGVARRPGPFFGIGRVDLEALDRAGDLAGHIRPLERRVELEAVAQLEQRAADRGSVVADAGNESEAGDECSGHAEILKGTRKDSHAGTRRIASLADRPA